MKEKLQEVIEMIENDLKIKGKYELKGDARKYAENILSDLKEIFNEK